MIRRWVIPLFLLGLVMNAYAEEFWLRYRFAANADNEIVNTSSQSFELTAKPPAGAMAIPGAIDPVSGVIKMAGPGAENQFQVVFARSKAGGARDTLWVSRDGNGSKAAVYHRLFKETHYGNAIPFGPVRLKLKQPEGELDYHALVILTDNNTQQPRMIVKSLCYYEDRIELEGKLRRVALVDTNANGRFNDVAANLSDCDWLMIDLNDDGRLDAYASDYKEVFTVGKYLKFGEKLYQLTVAPDGACFSLQPAHCAMGQVRIKTDAKQFKATMFGENGRLVLDGKNGATQAPCGTYKLVQANFLEPGASEQEGWRLNSRSLESVGKTITVAADKPAELVLGPPLSAALDVQKNGAQYTISLKLTGQAGEEYTLNQGYSNPTKPAQLKVQLVGSQKPAQSFSFEYG